MRVGWGYDVHRLGGPGPLRLAGVEVSGEVGLEGTSDADVAAHAVADALLGAAGLGDLGTHFPSEDPRWREADSMDLLRRVVRRLDEAGLVAVSLDLTVVAEEVRIGPHRQAMRERLAEAVGVKVEAVSVKATTTDGLGFVGRGEGLAAMAVALVAPPEL